MYLLANVSKKVSDKEVTAQKALTSDQQFIERFERSYARLIVIFLSDYRTPI